jgi:adenylate cyclase
MAMADERRLVTVLFADLVGFTGRAESSDPEAVREIQREYFAAVSAEVERYGGTLEKYIGDAVMAIFGAPHAHDDDAERALRAALGIRQAVGRLASDLEVRIGVNTGEVVGGMGSGPHAGDYTVSGDAVNVAARLQQTAEPNEILAGGITRRLSAEAFAFAPLSELALKGRVEGVEAWRLERELPVRPLLRGGEARLVGRTRELAAVASAFDEAALGRGVLVAVAGEAGIGKTRLALEARQLAEAQGFASAWTSSRPYTSSFPYHLLAQLTQQLLRRQPDASTSEALRARGVAGEEETLQRWAAVVDDMLDESDSGPGLADLSPAGRQRLLVQTVASLLSAAAHERPLLVVFDDLHWADPASLAVLEELLDGIPELPVAILALYRPGWSHGWAGRSDYQQLNLRALRLEESRQLAEQLSPDVQVSSDVNQRILDRSGGNPFFLEELLRSAGQASGQPSSRLPETIHEILLARLDALPPSARHALQLASVVGIEFTEAAVSAAAGDGAHDTDQALRELQRAELVVARSDEGGERTLAFRHALIHEVAYRSLLVGDRRRLHGQIARWLEEQAEVPLGDGAPAREDTPRDAVGLPSRPSEGEARASVPYHHVAALARHYRESEDLEKARRYMQLAGQRAEALNAGWEAKEWYLSAAEAFADEPARRAEMLEAAARQTYLVGMSGDATGLLLDAIGLYESVGANVQALNSRRWLGRYYWLQGNPKEADRQLRLAVAGLEALPPSPELAYAYSFQSQTLMLVPDYKAAEEWARKAIAVGEATNASGALVHAYNNLGSCLFHLGDEQGLVYLRRSLDMALAQGLADDAGRAYANMSGQGNRIFPFGHDAERKLFAEALEWARRTIPGGIFEQWIRLGTAEFLISSGAWKEAAQVLDEADWSRSEIYSRVEVTAMRSQIASYQGRYEEAAGASAGSKDAALQVGDLQAIFPSIIALVHAKVGVGSDEDAIAALRMVLERGAAREERVLSCWFIFEATDALVNGSRRDVEAMQTKLLAQGVELLSASATARAGTAGIAGDPHVRAVARALFGAAVEQLTTLGRPLGATAPAIPEDLAFPTRSEAIAVLDEEHRPFDAARIQLWIAEERSDETLLQDAATTFESLGARPYVARAARLLSPPAEES